MFLYFAIIRLRGIIFLFNFSEKVASFQKKSTDLPDTTQASNTGTHDVQRGDTDNLSAVVDHPSQHFNTR